MYFIDFIISTFHPIIKEIETENLHSSHFPGHRGKQVVEQSHHLLVVAASLDELILRQFSVSVDVNFLKKLCRPYLRVSTGSLAQALASDIVCTHITCQCTEGTQADTTCDL